MSSASDGGPITFLFLGTEDYVDQSKTILVVRAKVTKANGADRDADERVGVVNNFLHSPFKQVDVFLKEKQVTQAIGTYAYRSYLDKDAAGKFGVSNVRSTSSILTCRLLECP